MSKFLFSLLLFAFAWLFFKKRNQPADRGERTVEFMVRCASCGVHFPKSEAIACGGEFYCCEAHRPRQ